MSGYNILKAVEYSKTSAAWRKTHAFDELVDLGWWLQPKYDGCFGMAVIQPDHSESRMLSRTGEDYTKSCQHILDEIAMCALHQDKIEQPFVVLGEVWHPTDKFPKISGDFRRQRPSPHLYFVACDLLPLALTTPLVYKNRFDDLQRLVCLDQDGAMYDQVARVFVTNSVEGPVAMCPTDYASDLKRRGGYDGAILRDPTAGYTIGDAKLGQIVKVKPVLSLDLSVVAVNESVGEATGRAVYTIQVTYQDVLTDVGSGMPHKAKDVPGIGDIVEIECMGLTEDGKLREPRFKGIRHDKVAADN